MATYGRDSLVVVTWQDSSMQNGWHTKDELAEFLEDGQFIALTVGWVVKHDADRIVVAMSRNPGGSYADLQNIPTPMIVTVRVVSLE